MEYLMDDQDAIHNPDTARADPRFVLIAWTTEDAARVYDALLDTETEVLGSREKWDDLDVAEQAEIVEAAQEALQAEGVVARANEVLDDAMSQGIRRMLLEEREDDEVSEEDLQQEMLDQGEETDHADDADDADDEE